MSAAGGSEGVYVKRSSWPKRLPVDHASCHPLFFTTGVWRFVTDSSGHHKPPRGGTVHWNAGRAAWDCSTTLPGPSNYAVISWWA